MIQVQIQAIAVQAKLEDGDKRKYAFLNAFNSFHDGGRYHIETSPLICFPKSMDWFLYDNGLRHERVNWHISQQAI